MGPKNSRPTAPVESDSSQSSLLSGDQQSKLGFAANRLKLRSQSDFTKWWARIFGAECAADVSTPQKRRERVRSQLQSAADCYLRMRQDNPRVFQRNVPAAKRALVKLKKALQSALALPLCREVLHASSDAQRGIDPGSWAALGSFIRAFPPELQPKCDSPTAGPAAEVMFRAWLRDAGLPDELPPWVNEERCSALLVAVEHALAKPPIGPTSRDDTFEAFVRDLSGLFLWATGLEALEPAAFHPRPDFVAFASEVLQIVDPVEVRKLSGSGLESRIRRAIRKYAPRGLLRNLRQ